MITQNVRRLTRDRIAERNRPMNDNLRLLGTKDVGSRSATRVRIRSTETQPTSFDGMVGIVVDARDLGNVRVRLSNNVTLPFGISNLQVLS